MSTLRPHFTMKFDTFEKHRDHNETRNGEKPAQSVSRSNVCSTTLKNRFHICSAERPELRHAGPKDVNRVHNSRSERLSQMGNHLWQAWEASPELPALPGVGCCSVTLSVKPSLVCVIIVGEMGGKV